MVHPTAVGKIRPSLHFRFAQDGFTYLSVLFLVLMLLLSLGVASEHIYTVSKREREAELQFVGEQYRSAIASYYYKSPSGIRQLPQTLESLTSDKRSINTYRHLRKLYADPMTGNGEWGLVKTPQGEIVGIYSLSNEVILTTINKKNIAESINLAEGSGSSTPAVYSDWKFVFKPENKEQFIESDQIQ
jgi:type II secretory pathway pseudopilin PulG